MQREGTACLPIVLVNGEELATARIHDGRSWRARPDSSPAPRRPSRGFACPLKSAALPDRVLLMTPCRLFRRACCSSRARAASARLLACATAIALADSGQRVLLVSTDPASNLDEVLEVTLARPRNARRLACPALNIDPEQAARAYRERVVGPYRGVLPAAAVASIEEQLSGACTVEIAAFDEFSKLLDGRHACVRPRDIRHGAHWSHPPPPRAPAAWSLHRNQRGRHVVSRSALGPQATLPLRRLAREVARRARRRRSSWWRVPMRQRSPRPSARAANFTSSDSERAADAQWCLPRAGHRRSHCRSRDARACRPRGHARRPSQPSAHRRTAAAIRPGRCRCAPADGNRREFSRHTCRRRRGLAEHGQTLNQLVEQIAARGKGVVMTMGKAASARRRLPCALPPSSPGGHHVMLTTTDPAAHVDAAARNGRDAARHAYRSGCRNATLHRGGARHGRPGARRAGSRAARGRPALAVHGGDRGLSRLRRHRRSGRGPVRRHRYAPTGHTLLLLDAAEAYHRERRGRPGNSDAVQRLLPRLRDPQFTTVARHAARGHPIHEAMQLERDLARADITPFAWVVNQSLTPLRRHRPGPARAAEP